MPVLVETVFNVGGRRLERSRIKTRVMFSGVGSIMNLRITLPTGGGVEIVQTYLPIGPLDQQVAFHGFAERAVDWYDISEWR